MADGWLEKKMEDLDHRPSKSGYGRKVSHPGLDSLLLRNRSIRGYDKNYKVSEAELRQIIGVCNKIPSASNGQVLRYRMVLGPEAEKVLPCVKMAAALPEWKLPLPGTEPEAFVVICTTVQETRWVDMDLGIAAQSMLLKAVELGLNGLCVGAFDKTGLVTALHLPLEPLLLLCIGKSAEKVQLVGINPEEDHAYYRKNGLHIVPKINLEHLII